MVTDIGSDQVLPPGLRCLHDADLVADRRQIRLGPVLGGQLGRPQLDGDAQGQNLNRRGLSSGSALAGGG
jgi:hypothetical protein